MVKMRDRRRLATKGHKEDEGVQRRVDFSGIHGVQAARRCRSIGWFLNSSRNCPMDGNGGISRIFQQRKLRERMARKIIEDILQEIRKWSVSMTCERNRVYVDG